MNIQSQYKDNKSLMQQVRNFAMRNYEHSMEGEDYIEDASFELLGMSILYPFMDETARFEFSDNEAYAYYGIAAMDAFIREVEKYI